MSTQPRQPNMPIPPQQGYPQQGQPQQGYPQPQQQPQYQSTALAGLVAFGTYDQQAAEAEAKEAEQYGGDSEWFKFKDGPNVIRILPPPPGGKSPFVVRHRHWIDLPNGESVKFNCPKRMAGQYCPVCHKADELKKSSDRTERDRGFNMSPQRQALCVIIDRTNPDVGPQVAQLPGKSVYDLLVHMRNDPRGGGDYTNPLNGFDVIIKRQGGGGKKNTKYEVLADRNNSQLAETVEQMNAWIMGQPDITSFCVVPTDQEIREMIAQATGQTGGAARTQAPPPAPAPQLGAPQQGYAPQGYAPQGYPQQGYAPPPQGYAPPPQRAEAEIYNPGDYTQPGPSDDDIPF